MEPYQHLRGSWGWEASGLRGGAEQRRHGIGGGLRFYEVSSSIALARMLPELIR